MAIPTTFTHNHRLTRSQVPNAVWVQNTMTTWNLRRTTDSGSSVVVSVMQYATPVSFQDDYRICIRDKYKSLQPVADPYETLEEAMHVAEMLYLTGAYD